MKEEDEWPHNRL